MTRIALKIAYIGIDFEGFQIQPEKHTIEQEIFKALKNLKLIKDPREARYQSAGRTDKGVHAIGQVIAFNTDNPALALPRIINSKLVNSIWTWGHAKVPENFDPRRHAIKREYRYVLFNEDYDLEKMKNAAKLFLGEHDFANFSTTEKGRSTIKIIFKMKVKKIGNFLILDIEANSFAWNMVRKIVTALKLIGKGKREEDWLKLMLIPVKHREGLQSAPAIGTILRNISYKDIRFEEDIYAKKKACRKLEEWLKKYYTMGKVLEELATVQ